MILARVRLTLDAIYEVIATAPTDLKTAARPDLMKDRPVGQLLALMEARLTPENVPRAQRVRDYWLVRFPGYPDKTRAGVIEGMMARVGALSSGSLGRLFGSDMTWTPDRVYGGAVTVVDCPQLKFGEAGRLATCLLKCSYTRDVQRRPVGPDTQPVFLWCDEVQYVITSSDVMYATTARSARSITVFLSQNVSTLTAMLGGDMGADAFVHSLLGNLRTKFFHSCEESRTCSYLADLVGYEFVPVPSWTVPTGDAGAGSPGPSATMGMQRIFRVEPSAVQGLKTGGPLNDYQVEALVFRGGQPFASGKNFLKATFDQRTGGVR
jgi:type IV secretory pathway TraG/TraD family ATPase VirD4